MKQTWIGVIGIVALFVVAMVGMQLAVPSKADVIKVEFDIQEAINNAQNGDVILVPDGVYPGGIDFLGKAIIVVSEHGPSKTFIDGGETTFGVRFNTTEGPDSILEGFTITRCTGLNGYGGGMYCGQNTGPTIINCIITKNTALTNQPYMETGGGGVCCYRFSSPTFIRCTISFNQARSAYDYYTQGGGVCAFYASPTFIQCTIANNSARADGGGGAMGGGIAAFYGGHLTLKSCMVVNNRVEGVGISYRMGGGICLRYGQTAKIQGCTFSGNQAIIAGCPYAASGAGVYVGEGADAVIRSSILWHDFWNGSSQEIFISDPYTNSHVDIDYSDIEGGQEGIVILNATYHEDILLYGPMNIVSDPLFRNPNHGDFHIKISSPCIDAGETGEWPNYQPTGGDKDIDGNPRIIDIPDVQYPGRGPMDIGADEAVKNAVTPSSH